MLVNDRPLVYWDNAFWCGWTIAQGAAWPNRVVVAAPVFDEYLGRVQRLEDLAIEESITEAALVSLICHTALAIDIA
jgi:hypothetical protein